MRILHIITDLDTGGAEEMLRKLLLKTDRRRFASSVISLLDEGTLGGDIKALGVSVYTLGMKRGVPSARALRRIVQIIRLVSPDVIQGWMYHGNLAAQCASLFSRGTPSILWNIRETNSVLDRKSLLTAFIVRLGASLSRFPEAIINNSRCSVSSHQKALGYSPKKWEIIPNGFETDSFMPSNDARRLFRTELGLPPETLLVGHVGRYHPVKDHKNLLRAATILRQMQPDIHFAFVGRDVNAENAELMRLMNEFSLHGTVHLLGQRRDLPYVTAALDIATSSSLSEGFPNAIGEAMSCGVPCVVTDVGDCAGIIGETGRVVPPGEPAMLAQAWMELIEMGRDGRRVLGRQARKRVMENYSLESVVRQYESLYEKVYSGAGV